ncbi:32958_t:CDS:1, partial [Racocetra persica]
YLLQVTSLTNQKITQLSSSITKQIKKSLNLSLNTNNDILTNLQLLNISTFHKLLTYTSC